MRYGVLAAGALLLAALAFSSVQAAVTRDNFPPKSTADLVSLCTAQQSDPLVTAAVNYCQGFVEGAVEIALSYSAVGPQSHRPFCLPTPPPTLDQAAGDFASWASSDPTRLSQPAVVGLVKYLIDRYPCPHDASAQPRQQR
jgi:hypothetical protein